jgi:hypothetical protein
MIRIGKDFRRTPEEKSHRGVVADVAAPDVPVITDRPQTASDNSCSGLYRALPVHPEAGHRIALSKK